MYTGYPWGTEVPIGVNDRSEKEQKALDEDLKQMEQEGLDFSDNAAILARLGIVQQETVSDGR